MRLMITTVFACILSVCSINMAPALAQNQASMETDSSIVFLLYHRFGEDNLPSTNIRLEQFDAHIKELTNGTYNIMSMADAVQALKAKTPIPSRSIVITIDDAYKSVFENAWPRLKAANIPFTLFVSTEPVDQGHSNYMTWDDVRTLQKGGVDIGHHTHTHLHMIEAGREQALADIKTATDLFERELGITPRSFAYPYGEFTPELRQAIEENGFDVAFAQNSGPAAQWDPMFSLPRFPVNERFGDMSRFKLIANTKAMKVEDVTPSSPLIQEGRNPPVFGFSAQSMAGNFAGLACYPGHTGSPAEILTPSERRFEVRFDAPFPKGRNRINCTLPPGKDGRWSWFSRFFYLPGGVLD